MTIVNPHDAFFRQFLSRTEVARDFLQIHLPADIADRCQWDTLAIESSSFVEPDLRQYYSDIVYSMRIGSDAGYLGCVIEHVRREVVPLKSRKGKVDPKPYCCFPGAG